MSRLYSLAVAAITLAIPLSACGQDEKACSKEICAYIVSDAGNAGLKVRSNGTEDGVQWGTVFDGTQLAVECKLRTGYAAGQKTDLWLRIRWSSNTESTGGGDSSARAPHQAFVHSAFAGQTEDGQAPDCES